MIATHASMWKKPRHLQFHREQAVPACDWTGLGDAHDHLRLCTIFINRQQVMDKSSCHGFHQVVIELQPDHPLGSKETPRGMLVR